MKINFVPRDIAIRHENEWQAIREAVDERIDIGKRQTSTASSIQGSALVGKSDPSAVRAE
ncbi:hypothetical protein ABID08_004280 [Rhizobium binae]|uniref:Uncharacterized protein n=1 Tax=Rhizobium binae TaxID=1138190 RepID=A0ABV2MN00_9HYPH|nr:hypothetical protein [Rhizobium binae]MBX4962106.1 hypothetical protein [Rhizobium binae]MBX4991264.1 hypothetical protein [Rhizobium binae]NKL50446.1 hypothetical protein [Rhizobium leguminosarum bv. viciae]QSY81706.1 hypothetical protein J2J99_18980 [Rhizobium binae]